MKTILPLLAVILITEVTSQALFVRKDAVQSEGGARLKRQTNNNADQMVQNILQWIQQVYSTKNRKIRQQSLREYLPPSNTQRPRPFQPQTQIPTGSDQVFTGYPYPGSSPQPPFSERPIFTTPVASERPEENGIFPGTGYPSAQPEYTSKPQTTRYPTASTGYPTPSTGYTSATTKYPTTTVKYTSPTTSFPITSRYPTTTSRYSTPPTGFPGPSTGYPGPSTGYPGPSTGYPGIPTGYPGPTTRYPGTSTGYPGPTTGFPGTSTGYPGPTTGYPGTSTGYPKPTTEYPRTTTGYPGSSTGYPSSSIGYPRPTTKYPGFSTTNTGYQTSPTRPPYKPTDKPDTDGDGSGNGGGYQPTTPTDEDDKHPPHIHAIDVQCAKDMMTIDLEFNKVYNGIIYSKGFYNNPACRYVNSNSNRIKYTFTVSLNSCGTEFVNAFDTQGKSYLENVLVLQNEASIQEVWDTIRSVRCLWEGNLNKALSIALSVGMLTQEIVTFSGDTAMATLDIQMGRGPFAPNANGLVKIGETMTLVISVMGDAGFDIQVKDCRARDSNSVNVVELTDTRGCVLKPKLFGSFQKTRNTGNSGASIIAYAFFSAFKFPDVMDLIMECNIELCKTDCEVCPEPNQKIEPGKRRKREATSNDTLGEPVTVGRLLRVILPEDLNEGVMDFTAARDGICLSTQTFVFSSALLISLLTVSCMFSTYMWLKSQRNSK